MPDFGNPLPEPTSFVHAPFVLPLSETGSCHGGEFGNLPRKMHSLQILEYTRKMTDVLAGLLEFGCYPLSVGKSVKCDVHTNGHIYR